jgi:hypothetical protein
VALNLLLFGLILYGLVLIAANLHAVGERTLRRALTLFFVLTLVFFPLMYVDAAMAYLPSLALFACLEGLAQPLYFLVLNALTIGFGLRYLNRPAYAEQDRLTEHFVSRFKVTAREQEIIRLLLDGAVGKEIGERRSGAGPGAAFPPDPQQRAGVGKPWGGPAERYEPVQRCRARPPMKQKRQVRLRRKACSSRAT